MSNMRKSFEAKSKLRRMADGGIFKSTQRIGQDDIQVFTDAKYAAPDAQPYVPRAFRELPNQGITTGGVTTPLPAGAAPVPVITPAPPMPDPAKLSVGPPRAGMTAPPMPTAPAPVRTLSAYDKSVGNSALTQRQDPYDKMTGKPPVAVAARPRAPNIGMDYMAQSGGFGPTSAAPPPAPALRQMGAMGQPLMTSVGFAAGGHVKGPGGPTDDKVGPVMLSDGEYVLPADTVRAVGKHNLDAVKDATHTPVHVKQRRGLRKLVNGTPTEEEKRAVPRVGALGLPITTSVGEVNPIPRVGAMGLPITTSVGPEPMPPERTGALGLPITTSAGYGKPAAQPSPVSAEGWQGKPRASPKLVEAPVSAQPPQITSPTMTAAWQAAQTAPAGESTAGAIGRNLRGFGAAALAPVETGLRYMSGSLGALGGGVADLGAGLADVAPVAAPATSTAPTAEKLAPPVVRGPDGKFPGFDTAGGYDGKTADTTTPPMSTTPRGFASAQSAELERRGVDLGAQMNPVIEQKYTALPDAPQVGGTAIPGAAGPKALGDPNGAATAWADVPRTYRSDTIREGTALGEQANLGNGIFGTSSKAGGPMDTFTGVGANYNSESARLGPDPNGADRARQDAMVDAMFPDKPTPRSVSMPEFRSGARDINARFDKQLKAAEQRFTSPRAAGNLAKAQLQIEEARAAALNQDADNITRQQQSAMQFQSDQARNDLSKSEISQRAAQAARADETDRLGIDAQNARAADTAAATAQFKGMDLKQKEWATLVKNKQYYGDFNEFLAEDGLKKGGFGGDYVNAKEAKDIAKSINKQVQMTYGVGAGENADPEAAQAILANQQLMYGAPEAAVQTQGPAIAAVAKVLGRYDLGNFVGFVDSTSADRQASTDSLYRKVLDGLQGDEKALQFTAPDGTSIYVAQEALPPYATRHFTAFLKMQEERAKKKDK